MLFFSFRKNQVFFIRQKVYNKSWKNRKIIDLKSESKLFSVKKNKKSPSK